MIVRRLAAFFTLLAFAFFASTWLLRRVCGYPVADMTAMFSQGVLIIIAYFVIGMFLAKMAIALVNEVLDSKHQTEEDKRERARNLYLSAISGNRPTGLGAGLSSDPDAAGTNVEDLPGKAGKDAKESKAGAPTK